MTPAELETHCKGFEKRLKMKSEEANVHAWLIGAYVRIAVASALDSNIEYPELPFGVEPEETDQTWQVSKMKMAGFAAKMEKKLEKTEADH